MKIKIIHLVEGLETGGLEKIIAGIALGLDKKIYSSQVWCLLKGGALAEELKTNGVEVKILGIGSCYNPFNILKLIYLLNKSRPQIVHLHGYFACVIGRISAKFARVAVIISHLHTTFGLLKLRNIIIDKFLNLFTDKIICVSNKVKESFINAGYKIEKKSVVIYNGVDGEKFIPVETDYRNNILINVGSLYPHKGQIYILKALKIVLEDYPETRLQLVGDGPLRKNLEEECRNLGICSKVKFLGLRDDVSSLLVDSGIFILASLREGLSVALIEALACALPVIASNIGGVGEIVIDGENGLLFPPEDIQALSLAIKSMLGDVEKSKKMGLEGRKIFEKKFTLEIMLKNIDTVYQELIKK